MSDLSIRHIIRIVILILLQGLVFQRIEVAGHSFNYFSLLVYPVGLMLLPVKMSRLSLVLLGFVVGLAVDLFYSSLGVHASACVFMMFMRPYIMQVLEPRGGYSVNDTPTPSSFGLNWFIRYSAIMLGLFLIFYFSVEVFTFAMFGQILLKAVSSFLLSFLVVFSYIMLFNPK